MKMTKRDQILLAVIAVIAIVGGLFWFVIKPARADLSTQKDALTAVQNETNDLQDTIDRMAATDKGESKRTAERLRLSKALPENTETPGVVVQIQRIADRASVELTSIKTNNYSDYGSIRGTQFEVKVTGRFFDVDDFLYRLHRQVAVDEKDRPIVGGRLFATTSVDLTLQQDGGSNGTGAPKADDQVLATINVVAFSSVPGGAAAGTSVAPTTAVAAPATTTTATPTGAAPAPAVATPSSGGTQ
ncbi:MAG: type II secretion system protein GspM [Thermoleophilia bacterium]